jgi:hypothetical protein
MSAPKMVSPGARTSTLDPKLENEVSSSLMVVAPTVMAEETRAGETSLASLLSFPAGTMIGTPWLMMLDTYRTHVSACRALVVVGRMLTASSRAGLTGPLLANKMTEGVRERRVFWKARLMPEMTSDVAPPPSSAKTLMQVIVVSFATPVKVPPTTVARWVPSRKKERQCL